MHLLHEVGRTGAHADAARTATVADLAGTDAEVLIVVCHETTIGGRNAASKRESTVVVE
jgi:hypothetical protein